MMPILYVGGYSEMDGLKLTCEFTFNKKEQKENFKTAVLRCFTVPVFKNVLFSAVNFISQRMDTAALRN